jgi:methylated-DNA-[protein]-cysteine S-methyltransferase
MPWYVFYTSWGRAAVLGENRTVQRSVPPTLSLVSIRQYIDQTGLDARFVVLSDYSLPVVNKFRAYYEGTVINDWDVELSLDALPPFSRKVLEFVYTIPYGETLTYAEVAQAIGNPRATRAVGQALKRNPLPLIVPCHRVVATNGLGGFTSPGGIATKLEMLEWERKNLKNY